MALNSLFSGAKAWKHLVRLALVLVGWFLCYHLILSAGASGISRLFSTMAIVESRIDPADSAVRFAPKDPEAHYTRALTLINLQRLEEAVAELRETIRLRPHHYYEWLDLGVTLDRLGGEPGARAAFNESIRLAPGFSQPRWQLGNLLYRQGRYQEAFRELLLGAKSNPNLFKNLVELAWVATGGEVPPMEKLINPQDATSRLTLASFLAKHGKSADAVSQVRQAGTQLKKSDRALVRETIKALLNDKEFYDAYRAWAATHGIDDSGNAVGQVI